VGLAAAFAVAQWLLGRASGPWGWAVPALDPGARAAAWGATVVVAAALGAVTAVVYALLFEYVTRRAGWRVGAAIGALHAVFVSTVIVNVLLPLVHPRIATPETAANDVTLIEPPGFLMLNYGRSTFAVTLLAHMAYGAMIGWATRL
jgi:hypothetical protein